MDFKTLAAGSKLSDGEWLLKGHYKLNEGRLSLGVTTGRSAFSSGSISTIYNAVFPS